MEAQEKKPLGVAGKAIIRRNGKILLLQRSVTNEFEPGLWEFPGGKINFGENLIEALRREVREEVGLPVKVGRPLITWNFYKKPFWVTGITFCCDFVGGQIILSHEHDNFAWITPGEYIKYPLGISVKEQIESYLELTEC
jgi:8-oxo-dGTP diphosphatase